jgi:hypothetical protein
MICRIPMKIQMIFRLELVCDIKLNAKKTLPMFQMATAIKARPQIMNIRLSLTRKFTIPRRMKKAPQTLEKLCGNRKGSAPQRMKMIPAPRRSLYKAAAMS